MLLSSAAMGIEITVGLLLSLLGIPLLGFLLALPSRMRSPDSRPKRVSTLESGLEVDASAEAALGVPTAPEPISPAETVEAPPEAIAPEPEAPSEPSRPSLRSRLVGTRQALTGRLSGLLSGGTVDAGLLEELEAILFTADLGVATAQDLLDTVRKQASGAPTQRVREVLRGAVLEKLQRVEPRGEPLQTSAAPHVILVLGVNGSGKTTTIGKLAGRYRAAGKRVLLGAGDTFRAAASDQLEVWADRVGCEIVKGSPGGDPASVAFDAVRAASARGVDVALIDTAGRLQTRRDLMDELGKISKVISREIEDAPHETLLVLDSNTGQNAISQARLFAEVTELTGLVLTKLDGTAKGGVLVGLADEFEIPVRYIGVGEAVEDLQDFEAEAFVDAILES
ncbi:MAG: signal recognition particle-docking protein FtsY [Myxococcota bacterium]|nr:signal recognition particle-docking protein FtsY [Myxococcota bacterium]